MNFDSEPLPLSILGVVMGAISFFHEHVELMLLDITSTWPFIDTVGKLLGIIAVLAVIYMNLQVAWKARTERILAKRKHKEDTGNEIT
jgi:tetrahydromethanopterin S-methyltransferase subunit E